jgi:Spy/CpxP family protein refolding chaperone
MTSKAVLALIGLLAVSAVMPGTVSAQGPQGPPGPAVDPGNVTPVEIQRMFDAYALVQAQEQLKLDDDQYTQFLPRFKALQEVRRRMQGERGRTILDLRRLALDPKSDEAQIKERLKALQDLDARSAADLKRAYDAIDQVLDVRRQAQFRAFEELMERRKLELVTRARQNNRPPLRGRGRE